MSVPTRAPRRWGPDGFALEQRLPARPAAVAAARATVRVACRAWNLGAICDAVVLAVSELVTNVARTAAKHVTIRLLLSRQQVRLEVEDDQPGAPAVRQPPADAEGGRGLWLVDSVAARFGVQRTPAGKTVWAEFGRQVQPPSR